MKKFSLSLILASLVSFTASATVTELYQVTQLESGSIISKQVRPMIKVAKKSGLSKMSCVFKDSKGKRVAAQNVTVFEEYDLFVLVEANLYNDQHLKVSEVVCK